MLMSITVMWHLQLRLSLYFSHFAFVCPGLFHVRWSHAPDSRLSRCASQALTWCRNFLLMEQHTTHGCYTSQESSEILSSHKKHDGKFVFFCYQLHYFTPCNLFAAIPWHPRFHSSAMRRKYTPRGSFFKIFNRFNISFWFINYYWIMIKPGVIRDLKIGRQWSPKPNHQTVVVFQRWWRLFYRYLQLEKNPITHLVK